jgi:hypothetical protein
MGIGTNLRPGQAGKVRAWLLGALLAGGSAGALAFDLTPDRGPIAASLLNGTSFVQFNVFNVGLNNWGPVDNCNKTWDDAQWRNEAGKRIGSVVPKGVTYQHDDQAITNGWFTPNPKGPALGCAGSNISRGWDDEYQSDIPSTATISHSIKPTLFLRLDPAKLNAADENPNNNLVWLTTQWNAGVPGFTAVETINLPAVATTLSSNDSLGYGAYSTNAALGRIYITNQARTNTLTSTKSWLGYQGRQMIVNVTGTSTKNAYTIKNGSKVQADFLGQNWY